MLIAAYVGEDGEIADFFASGSLCLFEDLSGTWVKVGEASLSLDQGIALTPMKSVFVKALEELGADRKCTVFLAKELRGILRVFLEEQGFRVWKSHGTLHAQLSDARRQEEAALAEQAALDAALPQPDPVGDPTEGNYRFDLMKILSEGNCHVSRDLLMPFLETVSFAQLEVLCDHVPRWFPMELPELGLEALVPEAFPGDPMTVTVRPVNGGRSAPPGRRPGKSGCSCGG